MTASYPTGLLTGPAAGQPIDIVLGYLKAHGSDYGASADDTATLLVTDSYADFRRLARHAPLSPPGLQRPSGR